MGQLKAHYGKPVKVCVGHLDEFGEVNDCIYPPVGDNLKPGKAEKNWCFFSEGGRLRLYSTVPISIRHPVNQT